MASSQIHAVQTVSGNQPRVRRIPEKASQTFKSGVPVQLSSLGFVEEWDGATEAFGIAGFSLEIASNLTTAGVPKTLTYGSVPYQSSAVNIPPGAPLNDGRIGFEVANNDNIFKGQVGPSQTATQANVGSKYGMTKDTDGQWYVDLTDTSDIVCQIVKLDPQDPATSQRGVYFTILPLAQQVQG